MANGFEKIVNESFSKYFENQNIELSKRSRNKSLKESAGWSDFKSDVYNALSDVMFEYHLKGEDPTPEEIHEALEWFEIKFFEFGYDEEEEE